MDPSVIRLKPYQYIHVLNNNTNVTRVVVGPKTFTRQDEEKVLTSPTPMIMIPPRHFAIISNPVVKDEAGNPVLDNHGQVKIRHGDEEIRFEQDPFALFPGEKLYGSVSALQVVSVNKALRLRCIRDFDDRVAGDEWLFEGPATYMPRVEVQVAEIVKAYIVKPNQALKLKAKKACVSHGVARKSGEEWLSRTVGAYMPNVDEEIVSTLNAYVLTNTKALHLRASRTFTDVYGSERKAGEEWLVTVKESPTHIPDVYEEVVGEVKMTQLTTRQYCVVLDPWNEDKKKLMLGQKQLRKGEASFFLRPGERLESGIQSVYVLSEEEALLLRGRETYTDTEGVKHEPGDRWMVYGPRDYIPAVEVEVVECRRAIPLDLNEGIYIRDVQTGKVSMITGRAYMLKPNEELWEKELPRVVEDLLAKRNGDGGISGDRDKTRVVSYRAPHNTAVQIYDYKNKKSRVVLGPELVLLGPEEQFTVLSLSGDKPKRPHVIKALALILGPDFMTDIVIVETSDHARLSLKLSYNWNFKPDPEDLAKIFQVPDFVGDSCKDIASKVRGAVAATTFDKFHKYSASIIRSAVFGTTEDGKPRNSFMFGSNNLVINNIDIQSVEPVDQRTRDSLQKSVQLAIEITTKSQEAAARHEAERLEQEARGRLERQKITDEAKAEKARKELLQLQAQSSAVESSGQAMAEAQARADAAKIEGEASVKAAQYKAHSTQVRSDIEISLMRARQEAEITHQEALNDLELFKERELAKVEAEKFKKIVGSIGADTLAEIARAGPEMQAKLLGSLGLNSVLLTDGTSPVNLFQTAQGMISSQGN